MKPGNLFIQGAKSGGDTKDEDSICDTHRVRRCVFLHINPAVSLRTSAHTGVAISGLKC